MKEEDASNPDLIEGLSVKGLFGSFSGLKNPPKDDTDKVWTGKTLGSYELLEEIERGGMGIVFKARQASLDRLVAVKVLRSGGFAGEDELARFQSEAQVLGQLEHPHIVPVYDVGEEDGQPFLAMKFVEGGCLLGHVERCVADPDLAVAVMTKVAGAVHEAHRRGILHRDLKPANILLDSHDEPHVTDFGLARRVGIDSSLTATGAVMGSPNYISPELALGDEEGVTTAADIYGLGAVLFHLLTGRPPFEGDNPMRVLKAVTESAPPSPSSLNPKVDRDLATICLKCLHRDPQRRYSSARSLAADLQCWLNHEPIKARPATPVERLQLWGRRHPIQALMGALILLGAIGFLVMDRRYQAQLRDSRDLAVRGERDARKANTKLEAAIIDLQLERAEQEFAAGRQRAGLRHLLTVLEDNPRHRVAAERFQHEWDRRRFALQGAEAFAPIRTVGALAFARGGELMAGAGGGLIHLWDVDQREVLMPSLRWDQPVVSLGLREDGAVLMAASKQEVRLWDVPGGDELMIWQPQRGQVAGAAISPDGAHLFVANGRKVAVIDIATGREVARISHPSRVSRFAVAASRNLLAVTGGGTLAWWDLEEGKLLSESEAKRVTAMAFSGDGSRLAIVLMGKRHQIWNADSFAPVADPVTHRTVVHHVSLDQSGHRCAVGFVSGRLEISATATGRLVLDPIVETGEIMAMAFRPAHEVIVTSCSTRAIRQWDLEVPGSFEVPADEYISTYNAFGPGDGTRLQRDRQLRGQFSSPGNRVPLPFGEDEAVWHFAFSPDGRQIAVSVIENGVGRVELLDAATLEVQKMVLERPGACYAHYSPDGATLLVTSDQPGLLVWDCGQEVVRAQVPDFPGTRNLAFMPEAPWFVSCDQDGVISKWSSETGERLANLCETQTGRRAAGLALRSDGKMLVSGDLAGSVCWWSLDDGSATLLGQDRFTRPANWVSFNGDESMFVAGSRDGTARVWDTDTQRELCRIKAHQLALTHTSFTADGRHIRTVSMEARARLWDPRTGYPVTSALRHDEWWEVPEITLPLSRRQLEEFSSQCRLHELEIGSRQLP